MVELRTLDIVVLLIYLVGMALMGLYFSHKNKTTEDYFLGNRSFPGWAVGISMLGTSISSVTFLAFPAAAYILDYRQVAPNLMLPVIAIVAIVVFIPFFRRANLTSAFEYLGDRYGSLVRLYGAISFIIIHLIRLGTVLYLVSIPVAFLTGLPIFWVIIIGGIFIAFYTVAGGIEAVIWTDVVQTFVLIMGGLLCLAIVVIDLPHGMSQIIEIGIADDKFSFGSMHWDLNDRTFPIMLILGVFWWLAEYSSNQTVIQRYAAAGSLTEARKATGLCALMSVPTWVFFFFLGTCMYVFYQVFPDSVIETLNAEQILPYFIMTKVPAGIAGLVIAAILAAAMSSLDSSINAVATIGVVDIYKRYVSAERDETFYLRFARILSTIAAALMILGAMIFSWLPRESMVDLGIIVGAIFGGCLAGLFLVGFFTTRVDYVSALIALVIAVLFNIYLMLNTLNFLPEALSLKVHSYYISILVNVLFVVCAYGISLVRGRPPQNLQGLTVWTTASQSSQDVSAVSQSPEWDGNLL